LNNGGACGNLGILQAAKSTSPSRSQAVIITVLDYWLKPCLACALAGGSIPQWGCNENFPLRLIRHNHLSIFAKIIFAFSQKLHVKQKNLAAMKKC
jgi:hypothetical protein